MAKYRNIFVIAFVLLFAFALSACSGLTGTSQSQSSANPTGLAAPNVLTTTALAVGVPPYAGSTGVSTACQAGNQNACKQAAELTSFCKATSQNQTALKACTDGGWPTQ